MTPPNVLVKIAEAVRVRLEQRKAVKPGSALQKEWERACAARPEMFSLVSAFQSSSPGPTPKVIAEVKFASPSQGVLSSSIASAPRPEKIAGDYLAAGATALSVLTEQDHFHGHPDYLKAIRAAHPSARLLMKDFVIDEYQLLEGRVLGADAALLIVALLGESRTAELLDACRRAGLEALVEVHDDAELQIAARIGAKLIGVNNRDLKTLEISLDTSFNLVSRAPRGATLISESGISRGEELRRLAHAGFSGFLVGSSFMKTGDPGAVLEKLLREAVTCGDGES
jgi:indole-3-glycerol phosphate synthase